MFGFKGRGAGGGVTAFNGQAGAIGYAPVISVANLAALAALPTVGSLATGGLGAGQPAFVVDVGRVFILQAAIVATANAVNVIATSDDATRQWVLIDLCGVGGAASAMHFKTAEIDVAALTTGTVIVPAMPGFVAFPFTTPGFIVTGVGGVAATPATLKAGNNATHDNWLTTSATVATVALHGLGVNTRNFQGQVLPNTMIDLATPIVLDVTVAATGGVGFAYKGKHVVGAFIMKNPL